MSNDAFLSLDAGPHRDALLTCVRGRERKKFCRSNGRARRTMEKRRKEGWENSIFTFQTVGSVYKTRRWKKGRLSGGSSHLVPGCGQVLEFEGIPRREGLLNPPETRTLRPVPAKDPRPLFDHLNIDTAAKTSRRPYVFPPCHRRRPRGSNRRMNSTALFTPDYVRVYILSLGRPQLSPDWTIAFSICIALNSL